MAKYVVDHVCGHEETHDILGKETERTNRREWLVTVVCSKCRAAQKAAEMESAYDVVEMKYSEYKNNHAAAKTVPNSYNAANKTIQIYLKK